jgi:hypothetical protein
MEINFSRKWEYSPEWLGSKDDPKPIKVFLRYLTTEEKNSCFAKDMSFVDEKKKVTVNTKDNILFELAVEKIEGLVSNKKEITTAAMLLAEPGLSSLYNEIVTAIWNKEAELERELKNSL